MYKMHFKLCKAAFSSQHCDVNLGDYPRINFSVSIVRLLICVCRNVIWGALHYWHNHLFSNIIWGLYYITSIRPCVHCYKIYCRTVEWKENSEQSRTGRSITCKQMPGKKVKSKLFCFYLLAVFRLSCSLPKRPHFGEVSVLDLLPGGVARFHCHMGYHLQGEPQLTCLNASLPVWSGKIPSCRGDVGAHGAG